MFPELQPPPKPTHFLPLRLPWYPSQPTPAPQEPFQQLTYAPRNRWLHSPFGNSYQPFDAKASAKEHPAVLVVLVLILVVIVTFIAIIIVQASGLYNFADAESWLSWLSVFSPSSSSPALLSLTNLTLLTQYNNSNSSLFSSSSTSIALLYSSSAPSSSRTTSSSSSSSASPSSSASVNIPGPANITPLDVFTLNGAPATLSLQFVNASINALNPQGTFDYWPKSKYFGVGVLNTPLGAFCLAFKGSFVGFEMGLDYDNTFLGLPSIYYSFPATCPGCAYGCAEAAGRKCLVTNGADKSMHQLQGTTCTVYGGSGLPEGSQILGMTSGPFCVGISYYINFNEWQGESSGTTETAIFEFFTPIIFITILGNNLTAIKVEIKTGGIEVAPHQFFVPFSPNQWYFFAFCSNVVQNPNNARSTFTMYTVQPNALTGSWLVNPLLKQYINYTGNFGPVKGVSVDFGIYRGKPNAAQKLYIGQVNLGYTLQSVLPQTTSFTNLPTTICEYNAKLFTQSGAVSTWDDSSGNGATATPVNPAHAPVVDLVGLGGQYPAVQFGPNSALSTPAKLPVGQDFTIITVAQLKGGTSFSPLLGEPTSNGWAFGVDHDTLGYYWVNSWRAPALTTVPLDTPILLTMVYTAVNATSSFYMGGADVGFNRYQTGRVQDLLTIGCSSTQNTCWNGTIAYLALYAYALSFSERSAKEEILAGEFNLVYPYQISATQPIASPSLLPADGVSATTIQLTVLAPLTNQVTGNVLVAVVSNRGSVDTIMPPQMLVDGDGLATFTVTSTQAGLAEFTPVLLAGGDFVFEYQATVQFTGLILWYSALNVSQTYLGSGEYNDDFVVVWQDSTGNGNDADSTSACYDYYSSYGAGGASAYCSYPYEGNPPPIFIADGMNGFPTLQFFASDPYYEYDGVNSSTMLNMPSVWPVGSSFTVITLLNPSIGATGGMSVIGNSEEEGAVTLRLTSAHEIEFFLAYYTGGGPSLVTTTSLLWGQPLLITLLYYYNTPKANLTIFVNGEEAAFEIVSYPNNNGVLRPDVQLGCDDSQVCYTGGMSELLLWNEALTLQQLQQQWSRINSAYDL